MADRICGDIASVPFHVAKGPFGVKNATKNNKNGVLVTKILNKLNDFGRKCRGVGWCVLPNGIKIRVWLYKIDSFLQMYDRQSKKYDTKSAKKKKFGSIKS